MINENKIREELLRHADLSDNKGKKSIQEILTRDTKRVRRLKSITLLSWSLTGLLFLSVFVIQNIYDIHHSPRTVDQAVGQLAAPTFMIIFQALLLISVFLTISLYVRSKNLSIKQINSRLANIEEQLKNVLQSK